MKQKQILSYPILLESGQSDMESMNGALYLMQDKGYFLSPWYDSGNMGNLWQRLVLEGDFTNISLSIWISDKQVELTEQPSIQTSYARALLHTIPGRYLRFLLSLQGSTTPQVLQAFAISYPYQTYLSLLPQMYQEQADLHTFFAPLEEGFLQLQEQIRSMSDHFNASAASSSQKKELLHVLQLDDFIFEDDACIHNILMEKDAWLQERGSTAGFHRKATWILHHDTLLIEASSSSLHPSNDGYLCITPYQSETLARRFEMIMKKEIAFGVPLHFLWLHETTLDASFLDIGFLLDTSHTAYLDNAQDIIRLVV